MLLHVDKMEQFYAFLSLNAMPSKHIKQFNYIERHYTGTLSIKEIQLLINY